MSSKPVLKIDWATHEAAKYAVEHWHYSECLPNGNIVKVGAWEGQKFIGVVIFGHGAAYEIGSPYGLTQFECIELVRVALSKHVTPTSKVVAIALRFLKSRCPKLRLVVSYADPGQGHHGGIYQAMNWVYEGQVVIRDNLKVNGETQHPRSIYSKYGTSSVPKLKAMGMTVEQVKVPGKHKYLMPLDGEMRSKTEPLRKPYPKRASSKDSVASEHHSEEGGASPTDALQMSQEKYTGKTAERISDKTAKAANGV